MTKEDWKVRNVLSIELVAAYVRVSHQEQKLHGLSLDAQKMKLTEYAEQHNMKIVEWYVDEGVSGRKPIKNRPELQRMIQDAEQKKFDRIIFIKLDRFFRSVAEYHECMKRIAPIVWTTTEEKYDLSTAQGRMLVNMKLTIAEMEADQGGERVDIVNEYKVSTGQPISGSMPFGFKIETDPNTGRKKVIKHPEQKEIVEDLLDFLFTHQSKRKAVVYLNAKHHISMTYGSLTNLVENPLLCGEYRGNKNYTEAYLTREEFDKLQKILKMNVKQNTADRDYIFSGLIRCPSCDSRLAGTVATYKKKNGKVYKYKKYRCANCRLHNRCDFVKVVNETVIEQLLLNDIEKYLNEAKVNSAKVTDAEDAKIRKHNIDDIHTRIDRLNYSWQTGKIRKVETYEAQYAELLELLKKAEAEQGSVEVQDFSKIEAILQTGWKNIYNSLDDAHKRAFWRSFIRRIDINWATEKKEITRVEFF